MASPAIKVYVRVTLAYLEGDCLSVRSAGTITAWRVCRMEGRRIRSEQLGLPSAMREANVFAPESNLYCQNCQMRFELS